MKTLVRFCFSAATFAFPIGALAVHPAAAQSSSGKAVTSDTAPTQSIPGPSIVTGIEGKQLGSVLGIEVRTNTENSVGRIVDLLANRSGQVEAAVIEFGGFLGMGTRKIAIEWSALRLETTGKQTVAILDMPRDQLRAAPEYKAEQPIVVRKQVEPPLPAETAPPVEAGPPEPAEQPAAAPPPEKQAPSHKRKRRTRDRE
jgi:hypothetical protein